MDQLTFVPLNTSGARASVPTDAFASDTVVTGSVEKIQYFNEDTGLCALSVRVEPTKQNILVSGRVSSVYPGQAVTAEKQSGKWELIELRQPLTPRSLKKFLLSDAFPQMKSRTATLLVQNAADFFFTLVEDNPEKFTEIPGIGPKTVEQIVLAWNSYKGLTAFEVYLFENSLPLKWAKVIWKQQGPNSLEYFEEDPYRAAREHRFEFEIIDPFALKKGFTRDSESRIRACLHDLLLNHYKQGHCAYPESELLKETEARLTLSSENIENALEIELAHESLIDDEIDQTPCIYLSEIFKLEREVAKKLIAFVAKEPPWGWFNLEKVLRWAQSLLNIKLAPLQIEAIETALSSSLTVITGGPGTGKTTMIRSLSTILQTQYLKIALCSPTGRAAQRLEETTGTPAQTIHRLLKYNGLTGKFGYNSKNPLKLDLVLVDEASMVDLALMWNLLDALSPHCALILVGDADQIPSVGAGNVLQSLIDSTCFSTVKLTQIYRQHHESLIKINANRINSGEMPMLATPDSKDFHYIPVQGIEETKSVVRELATRVLPEKYGITDPRQCQILVPLNRGPLGSLQLNKELQACLNKNVSGATLKSPTDPEQVFKVGDKVMVIKNDYSKDVFNGDIGYIKSIDFDERLIDIQFETRNVLFSFDELDRLILAYAISVHKSQGSEYRAVIVVISHEHLPMAQRHLIYTAVTRGKEQVFLVAEPRALQAAVVSDEHNRRWQKLTELLMSA
jgi:exodeoxyribonuclease V alpha subunit